ncbi:MAG TPA: hypothetical protein VGI59_09905 [Candidatus Udaeobacter sp.]|jgi:hypothetical protein
MWKLETKWGPKKLRELLQAIIAQINAITPVAGPGISIDYTQGAMIMTDVPSGKPPTGPSATPSGKSFDIYGSLNGAPAVYHVLTSADPTPIT